MTEPISIHQCLNLQENKISNFRKLAAEMIHTRKLNEPDTRRYEWFISEDGTTCHINGYYRDSNAAMRHFDTFTKQYAERLLEYSGITSFSVYGNPNNSVRTALHDFDVLYLSDFGGFRR